MKITFTELFNMEIASTVSKENIINTIKKPEQIQLSEMDNNVLFVCSQTLPDEKCILIILGFIENNDYKVSLAFKFIIDNFEQFKSKKPLEILKEFVEKYGLNIKVGYTSDIFIHHQTFWVETSTQYDIVKIENPNNNSFIQSIMIKIEQHGSKNRVDCHLAFCINKDKYFKDIKEGNYAN